MKTKKTININGKSYILRKSVFTKNLSPVHISDNMTGKMLGIPAISTSCLCNPICRARMRDGNSICAHCFASATLERYKDANLACESNYNLFNEQILDMELLPLFKDDVVQVRGEAFGDSGSVTHAINLVNIGWKNPHVFYAVWSKNEEHYYQAFKKVGKPKNLFFVLSSEKIGEERIPQHPEIVDHVFTVYAEDDGHINCGARCCKTCERCYHDGELSVRELLK